MTCVHPMAAWAVASLLAIRAAAQAPAENTVQELARTAWKEGAAAFAKADYEGARAAFERAFALTHELKTLQSLGEAELRSGHVVEAARHLSQFLHPPIGSEAQRDLASRSLEKAMAQVVQVDIDVSAADAEVWMDDETIGPSPIGASQFVAAGVSHVLKARKDALLATETFQAAAGEKRKIVLALGPAAPAGALPAAGPGAPLSSGAAGAPADAPARGDASASSGSAASRARTIVLIGGATLSGVALGVGVIFGIKTVHDGQNADAYRGALPFNTNPSPCVDTASSQDATNCAKLRDALGTQSTDRSIAVGALVSGGVLGAATVATALLWPRRPGAAAARSVSVAPLGQLGTGAKLSISF